MILFVLMIFTIYGGVHAYAFVKARSVFAFGPLVGAALGSFMLLMVFAIFLVRTLETHEYELSAQALSYVAYFWMAVLFLFFCGSLLFDGLTLVTRAIGWITRNDISAYLVPVKTSFYISLGLACAICAYGYFEAKDIRTERLVIETTKLPAGIDRLTIVQMSDVHLGLINRCERFSPMIKAVKDANPDIFVVTGDLVDAQINHLPGLADMLREVTAKFGKYAIMGNHEYYAGPEKSLAFIREAGLTLLRDEVAAGGPVTIVGVDDRTAIQLNLGHPSSEKKLLSGLPRDRFILFLKHQPRIDPNTIGLFDLQLSGHTHKGQIFPFTLLTHLSFPLIAGNYELGKGSLLHISRGTGTWGPPVRFLAPPEVTIIELVRKTSS
ncbi:MAG: metallophosphoesterase [Nitrospirae bacterium]|nr:metallophosphoesterase [Nitrospirota bacterium]